MIGLLSTKEAAQSIPFLIALLIFTIWFINFCKGRYEPTFRRYPLQLSSPEFIIQRSSFGHGLRLYVRMDAFISKQDRHRGDGDHNVQKMRRISNVSWLASKRQVHKTLKNRVNGKIWKREEDDDDDEWSLPTNKKFIQESELTDSAFEFSKGNGIPKKRAE
ncbi:hypothetical protein GH714_043382 [Hevea brasiliensis]|uniref:Uncharacterized protein n=1 Tax=Hevea brasiliensis TaxID=3981 RepID=A0A6A6K3L8_HEVBR|nr:hypothetical protein GH714_043382 [Hevea brasiliensis]